MQATRIGRERTIFAGVGGKLVQREPDGLRGTAFKRNFGPRTTIREPMRSAKGASWAQITSSTPLLSF
jgi:hypothetical protein